MHNFYSMPHELCPWGMQLYIIQIEGVGEDLLEWNCWFNGRINSERNNYLNIAHIYTYDIHALEQDIL